MTISIGLYSFSFMKIAVEDEAEGELRLEGIADSGAEEAVEVEQRWRAEWVDVVLVVEEVEDFNARDQLPLVVMEAEGTCDANVGDEELVVLAEVVAAAVDAVDEAGLGVIDGAGGSGAVAVGIVGDGWRVVVLQSQVALEAEGQ